MWKALAKELTPPVVLRVARKLRRRADDPVVVPRVGFFGNYSSYGEALADCDKDYQSDGILEVTRQNTKKVRDSGRVDISPHLAPFFSSFFLAAADLGSSTTNVIDYGGAMGAHYFHVRKLLPSRYKLRWRVVDLPRTSQIASEEFASDELSFADKLDASAPADVIIASGVFQVLADPHDAIRRLLSIEAKHFIFPLIPIAESDEDRLTVEYVSPSLAEMSIPHWFFSRASIEQSLSSHRQLATWRHAEYSNPLDGKPCEYFGYHLVP